MLAFDPDGGHKRIYATGLRNCSGMSIQPANGALWCAVNERDGLGDDLPPDFATRVTEGAFFGWPWYYIGAHEDPRQRASVPTSLEGLPSPTFCSNRTRRRSASRSTRADAFPAEYKGDAFVALHGSWNRAKRTGYKVVRLLMKDGKPTGVYEDFLVGFVADDASVWGRPSTSR